MVNGALNGRAATMLVASSILEANRAVMYTDPTVNVQLTRKRQITSAFAIVDRVISTRSRRDSTSVVTGPFLESKVSSLTSAVS